MNIEQIKSRILENQQNNRNSYDGLTSSQIADYNRRLMFGENDEAFPSDAEWSTWVD